MNQAAHCRNVLLVLLGISSLSVFVFTVAVQSASVLDAVGEEVNAVFEKAKPAVVHVRVSGVGFVPSASGFFIDSDGSVVTSSVLVSPDNTAIVRYSDVDYPARAIGTDPHTGLALLHINATETPSLQFGTTSDLKTGYAVIAIGYPLDLPVSPSPGFVTGFDIRFRDQFFPTTHIHANASISPGELGGPVLKSNGTLAGMIANTPDANRTIYILPSEAIQKAISDFKIYGKVRQGWGGINISVAADAPDSHTARVSSLAPGSPASKSGIEIGDTILRIDSREIHDPADLMDASFFSHPGDTVNVFVRREDQLFTFPLVLTEKPETAVISAPANTPETPSTTPSGLP